MGEAEFIHQFTEPYVDEDAGGEAYAIRVYGRAAGDRWEGWIEFHGTRDVRRTDVEASHESRRDLSFWATGLSPSYLEGAWERSLPVNALIDEEEAPAMVPPREI